MSLVAIPLFGVIKGDQDRQGPRATGEGEVDEHGEDDPLVALSPCCEGVRGAHGVAVPRLAINVRPGVGDDRVIAGHDDRGIGGQEQDDLSGQATG